MSIDHFNMDPALLSDETREMLWPSWIMKGVYLSGEAAASNFQLLKDFRITHIIVCGETKSLFATEMKYMKVSLTSDFGMQVDAVTMFMDGALHTDTNNVSSFLDHLGLQ